MDRHTREMQLDRLAGIVRTAVEQDGLKVHGEHRYEWKLTVEIGDAERAVTVDFHLNKESEVKTRHGVDPEDSAAQLSARIDRLLDSDRLSCELRRGTGLNPDPEDPPHVARFLENLKRRAADEGVELTSVRRFPYRLRLDLIGDRVWTIDMTYRSSGFHQGPEGVEFAYHRGDSSALVQQCVNHAAGTEGDDEPW